MDIQSMENEFIKARDHCLALQKGPPTNEAEELFHWLLNTEVHPYGVFFDPGFSDLAGSIQGLMSLFFNLHHALMDDGDLSFIEVNDVPHIVFLHPSDFDNEQAFWECVNRQGVERSYLKSPQCSLLDISVSEFIVRAEAYETALIRRCFLTDSRRFSLDFVMEHYGDKACFDPAWVEEAKVLKPFIL